MNALLDKISSDAMCMSCGICQGVLGKDKIKLTMQANGNLRPLAQMQLSTADLDTVYQICPSTRIEVPHEQQADLIWGAYQSLHLGWAVDADIRHRGSTGGVLTALALYLLESGEVDFILHARQHATLPSFGEATISRNRSDILHAAGSRYGPTATLLNIKSVLQDCQRSGQRFAFIGTPCDVTALRNYARIEPRVNEFCYTMLTLVCGGFMAPEAMHKFLQKIDIDAAEIVSIRYRGYGCPGDTVITLQNGDEQRYSYLDFWGNDESAWGLPARCKICPDGIGEAADIAAADTWPGGSPDPHTLETDPGTNAIIVRTAVGETIIQNAIVSGYLQTGAALDCDDLNRFQPHQEKKKRALKARMQALVDADHTIPQMIHLRLDALANTLSETQFSAEYQGTNKRIKEHKFSEPAPV